MPACSTGAPYSKAHLKDHRTRRPTGHAAKEHMNLIQKRFDNTRFTYFYPGQNACGGFDNNESMIVALNEEQWDGGSHCHASIIVEFQGKAVPATITDMTLAGSLDAAGSGAAAASPTKPKNTSPSASASSAPPKVQQQTLHITPHPSPTSTLTSPSLDISPSSSHSHPAQATSNNGVSIRSGVSHGSAGTSVSPSTARGTLAPTTTATTTTTTTTATPFATGNIENFNLALLQLVGLADAIFAADKSEL
ncbi:uncharacterized protein TRAVEDRAFT_17156 [Trametes versicolor FP-101664 SS1]|uniref:uncharacterized protein n=1 Tax=Trametes versicolor (strain FP-101664) TaxID=717944 RepID=UPI0004622D9F|nr:uncharacterized protein TRAVEDRAFT_17156 [Trametes versicolor FP-101664 SS1]EIW62472.1 hypothetical protein TRAVEDRAFT_17156 [Trametes versicolor FP-101664 SS1]